MSGNGDKKSLFTHEDFQPARSKRNIRNKRSGMITTLFMATSMGKGVYRSRVTLSRGDTGMDAQRGKCIVLHELSVRGRPVFVFGR